MSHPGRYSLCRLAHLLSERGELRDRPRRDRGDRSGVAARGLGLGLVWGLSTSAIALAIRSIWPIVAAHWALNVWMDLVIWQGW